MKVITLLLLLPLMSLCLYAQQIDENLLSQFAELRKVDCDSALSLLLEHQETFQATSNEVDKGQFYMELGLTHYCLGNYEDALKNYQLSLGLFKVSSVKSKPSEILNLIGTLHKKQGNFELAKDYFQQGLNYATANNDSLGIGNSLNNIGVLLFQQQQFEKSLSFYLKSTRVKSAIKDTIGLSYNYDNLGMNYAILEQFDSAQYYFELAKSLKLQIGDRAGYGFVTNNIGEMLMSQGKFDEAAVYFEEALEVARNLSYPEFEQHVLNMISSIYEKQEDFKSALNVYKKHIQIKDSLFNERKSKQVAELETKYQTEKKEQTIAIQAAALERNRILLTGSVIALLLLSVIWYLWRNRTKKKHQILLQETKIAKKEAELNAAIASQEKERARYARDLHDGFGQMISILNMNLGSLKKDSKPDDRQKVFEESEKVIEEMYSELKNICFDLMPQTLIKNGLVSGLQEFADRINKSGKLFVETSFFDLDHRLAEPQEISLYRITQEWINNILKYSNADKITLQITKDDQEITLMIEDNGKGFDKSQLVNSKGNGWKNLNLRANLIQGEIELETQEGVVGNVLIINAPAVLVTRKENTLEVV